RQLARRGHSVAALHGDRSQIQRQRALADLKRGRVQILVATDIASRGIDVEDISHVINYDVPHTPEDYVHRIGRTGRVEAIGDAFTLMSPEERDDVAAIERFLGRSIPRVLIPDFDYKRAVAKYASAPPRGLRDRSAPARRGGRGEPRDGYVTGARSRAPSAAGSGRSSGGSGGSRAPIGSGSSREPASPSHGRRPQRNAPDR